MLTPNCNIICLSWKNKNWHDAAHGYYHTVCPFTINKQTMDIIDFISECQYMQDSANYGSKNSFTYKLQLHPVKDCHFRIKILFFYSLRGVIWLSNTTRTGPSAKTSSHSRQTFPTPTHPPQPRTKAEQQNFIAQKLYIGLGNRKAEEKTDSDKHYIATSAKCIVKRNYMLSCFTQWRHQTDKSVILFIICTTYVFTFTSSAHRLLVYTVCVQSHFSYSV